MKPLILNILRKILVTVIAIPVVFSCTVPERETSSSVAQSERVVPQKSEEQIYMEKREEAVRGTIDIYNQILEDD